MSPLKEQHLSVLDEIEQPFTQQVHSPSSERRAPGASKDNREQWQNFFRHTHYSRAPPSLQEPLRPRSLGLRQLLRYLRFDYTFHCLSRADPRRQGLTYITIPFPIRALKYPLGGFPALPPLPRYPPLPNPLLTLRLPQQTATFTLFVTPQPSSRTRLLNMVQTVARGSKCPAVRLLRSTDEGRRCQSFSRLGGKAEIRQSKDEGLGG